MKKTFTLMIAFLLLLGYKVQSQEVDKLFSLSGITSSDEVETTKFTYNENQLLESSHYLLFDGTQIKDSLIYDDANNISKINGYQLIDGNWRYVWYIEYTYDENNNRITRTNYNNFGDEGFFMGGIYHYQYDENNRLTYWEMYFAGDDYFSQCGTLTYNNDGLLVEEVADAIDFMTGILGKSWKLKYMYDGNNNLVKSEQYMWTGNTWQYSTSEVYTFDNNNNCLVWDHYVGNNITDRNEYSYDNTYTYDQIVYPENPESIIGKAVPMAANMVTTKKWYTEDDTSMELVYVCDFNYIYDEVPSSIDNCLLAASNVRIYPNPASETLNVLLSNDNIISKVELLDASGKNVYTLQNINRNNCSLDINSLDKGMYIINITTSRGIIADKVIVK
ncbi:MAG: T9SS type A sorting domain-containing protein [Bacteroidales bacterium]|jgi:hypothetical protein